MLTFLPEVDGNRPLRLLCIGAHSDDAEIGCAATVMKWLSGARAVEVAWIVLSAAGAREAEARRSARALLARASVRQVIIEKFRDRYFPAQYPALKAFFDEMKNVVEPDIVFTHRLEDRHQDHRLVSELTWNTWRDHVILEYEIPKYEGDLGTPNVYVTVPASLARRKGDHLDKHFGSQRSKDWFSRDMFVGLMRLRGVECRSKSGFAEAFHVRKLTLG